MPARGVDPGPEGSGVHAAVGVALHLDHGVGAGSGASGEAAGFQRDGETRAAKRPVAVAAARRLDRHHFGVGARRRLGQSVSDLGPQLLGVTTWNNIAVD